jgi:hypothetical protein
MDVEPLDPAALKSETKSTNPIDYPVLAVLPMGADREPWKVTVHNARKASLSSGAATEVE